MFLKVDRELDRCERVMRQRVLPHIDEPISACTVRSFVNPGEPEPSWQFLAKAKKNEVDFQPCPMGTVWGTTWGTTWFEITGTIPQDIRNKKQPVELIIDLGWNPDFVGGHLEALCYRPDGTAMKGVNPRNQNLPLITEQGVDSAVHSDGSFTIYVEGAYNPLILGSPSFVKTELGNAPTGKADQRYVLQRVDLCLFNQEAFDYYEDLDVLYSLLPTLDKTSLWYFTIAKALQRSMNVYDERELSTLSKAREILKPVLETQGTRARMHLSAVGHSHIDSAWLWPVRETRRKVARTVANALSLMEQDPSYIYAMSSAQQYAWLEEDHPDLFARVQEKVKEGRIVPVGGMWVESDGMLPSGESLIRQLSYGQRYFQEKLGVKAEGVWLPDSFGYTQAWPQIAKRSGYRWFLTQKIAWSDTTRFPHHTFMWEGLDGSRIFTHFPPTDTYDSVVSAKDLKYTEQNFRNKELTDRSLLLFGYGDGGGGPNRQILARVHRYHDLNGVPAVNIESPLKYFDEEIPKFKQLSIEDLPVWKGELYLELHRKTLTSQQEMKHLCRLEETTLRITEYLCLYASLVAKDYHYPQEALDKVWKTLLLNQFHDILPGSGIAWLYRVAKTEYQRDLATLHQLIEQACAKLRETFPQAPVLPEAQLAPAVLRGEPWVAQPTTFDSLGTQPVHVSQSDEGVDLNNEILHVHIDPDGFITSVVDLAHRKELVANNHKLGAYELFHDEPEMWDAWNLERDALMTGTTLPSRLEKVDEHDGKVTVHVISSTERSEISTAITLEQGSNALTFQAHVSWHEEEKLLKVDLPLALSSSTIQSESQYGVIDHPVVKNLPEDDAKFEFCTQRFVRVQEGNEEVSIVNATTYGADAYPLRTQNDQPAGTMVRLTLLSSPVIPDPETDRGEHNFSWTLSVNLNVEQTTAQAYQLGSPVLKNIAEVSSLAGVDSQSGSVILDWMKPADDGSGDVILRLYEAEGTETAAELKLNDLFFGCTITEVSCLEDGALPEDEPYALESAEEFRGQPIALHLKAFELATLRIKRR